MAPLTSIATLPRVFLNPVVPGWYGSNGNVRLPLHMSGTTMDIGIHKDDERGLTAWVEDHRNYFASIHQDFDIYPTESSYQAAVHPPWISNVRQRISKTISEYAASLPASSRFRQPLRFLEERWPDIQTLLSAALYMGNPDKGRDFTLFPQDLTLFGPELSDVNDLDALLSLLANVTHIDDLLRTGMTDVIEVREEEGETRLLHDAMAAIEDPAKNAIRPVCVYDLDEDRKINPFQPKLKNELTRAFDDFQKEVTWKNALVTGAYLMAHFKINDDDLRTLRQSGFRPDALQSRLRATGRRSGPAGNLYYANLLSSALGRLADAS
ncbi:MAG TPA: hypothetical protein VFX30_06375 [bacterium]|nr:hypothetical protein [bacterium]